jgi:outer membrane protein TolC
MASLQIITKRKKLKNQSKMRFNKVLYLLLFLFQSSFAVAQERVLTIENTIDIVRKFHPVVKQSLLQNEISRKELMVAKSNFDPTVQISTEEKTFDNQLYYQYNNSELKIPTWYGLDFKAGLENNIGVNLDPSLSKYKTSYLGVSMDPFRGILVDKRKSVVNQAKYFVELTRFEQKLVVNDLILDASVAYWNWVNAYYVHELYKKSVVNNKQRFEVVKKAYLSGDRAAIDTTESLMQLQTIEMMEVQAYIDLQKARFELSNFFWAQNGLPYSLDNSIVPDKLFIEGDINPIVLDNLEQTINNSMRFHPKIEMTNQKMSILEIEKRLKTVELFPSLKMNYNLLEKNYQLPDNWNNNNNYKYGFTLSLPLFQRRARGELGKTKNKIENLGWDRKYLSIEIENKIRSNFAEFTSLKQQIAFSASSLEANKTLLDTEDMKFKIGESSLFLINSREMKYLESEQKNISLRAKFYTSIFKNKWAAGTLE